MAPTTTSTMNIKVYSPFRTYFDGEGSSISATNKTGPFDVLVGHKNFMTLLIPSTITVRVPGKPDFKTKAERGVMHVRANKVTVFLDV